ncbi:MAG TPA: BRCT domain-containing protein, partial [Corynebacterium sp.]|nr:BRCT domain-containing protein [Corynebacterium sp.]
AGKIFVEMQQQASMSELAELLATKRRNPRKLGVKEVSKKLDSLQLKEVFGNTTAIQGENICFTGTLTRGTRAEMEEFLLQVGATPAKSVTKKTTILVVGVPNPAAWREGSSASRKLHRASELREKGAPIQVLSEEDFFALLGE